MLVVLARYSRVEVVNLNTNKMMKLTHVSNGKLLSYCIGERLDAFRCFFSQDDVIDITSNDKDDQTALIVSCIFLPSAHHSRMQL